MPARALALVSMLLLTRSVAAVFVIDFDQLDTFDRFHDFYNGGFNLAGEQGPEWGVELTGAFTVRNQGNTALSTDEQFGPLSARVEGGFEDGFALRFVAISASIEVSVFVYDNFGQLLGSSTVAASGPGYAFDTVTNQFVRQNWTVIGLAFEGTAYYVLITDDYCCTPVVEVDDYTFGRSTLVPLPGALWLFVTATTTLAMMRRRERVGGRCR